MQFEQSSSFEGSISGHALVAPKVASPTGRRGTSIDYGKYKTKLCRNYIMGVPCPFGDRCVFAHGESELHAPVKTSSPAVAGHSLKFHGPSTPTAPPSYSSFMASSGNNSSSEAASPVDSAPPTPPAAAARYRYEPYSPLGIVYEN